MTPLKLSWAQWKRLKSDCKKEARRRGPEAPRHFNLSVRDTLADCAPTMALDPSAICYVPTASVEAWPRYKMDRRTRQHELVGYEIHVNGEKIC